MSDSIILKLNQYQAGNLRWLLQIAMSAEGTKYAEQFPNEGQYVRAEGLFTGDWTGEICWELEQQMIDADMEPQSNLPSPWPLTGWGSGQKSKQQPSEDFPVIAGKVRGRTRKELIERCRKILDCGMHDENSINNSAETLADLLHELTGNSGVEPAQ